MISKRTIVASSVASKLFILVLSLQTYDPSLLLVRTIIFDSHTKKKTYYVYNLADSRMFTYSIIVLN